MDTIYEENPVLNVDISMAENDVNVLLDSEQTTDVLFDNTTVTITRNQSNTGVDITATDSISGSKSSATLYDGKTPTKGVDYLTSNEIEEIKNQIFTSLGEALLSVYPHAEEAYNG